MNLVDKQHVVLVEIGQYRRQIARPLDRRSARDAKLYAELVGNDVRKRGLTQSRRTVQQHVVERLAALFRRLDKDAEIRLDLLLAHVIGQTFGAQRYVEIGVVSRAGARHKSFFVHTSP